ncbi:MAG: hypothetical protein ACRCY9_13285 [Phycicoccus sp.]
MPTVTRSTAPPTQTGPASPPATTPSSSPTTRPSTTTSPTTTTRSPTGAARPPTPARTTRPPAAPAKPKPVVGDSASCSIKGNIAEDGEKIYHLPGQRYYDKTKIEEPAGERWFCTEQDAVTAGWRQAKV